MDQPETYEQVREVAIDHTTRERKRGAIDIDYLRKGGKLDY